MDSIEALVLVDDLKDAAEAFRIAAHRASDLFRPGREIEDANDAIRQCQLALSHAHHSFERIAEEEKALEPELQEGVR